MCFVGDEDDGASSFVFLGGEQVRGLWDQGGFVEAGFAAAGGDDPAVEAAAADGGVAQVDGGVPGGFQGGDADPPGAGLACPDLAGAYPA